MAALGTGGAPTALGRRFPPRGGLGLCGIAPLVGRGSLLLWCNLAAGLAGLLLPDPADRLGSNRTTRERRTDGHRDQPVRGGRHRRKARVVGRSGPGPGCVDQRCRCGVVAQGLPRSVARLGRPTEFHAGQSLGSPGLWLGLPDATRSSKAGRLPAAGRHAPPAAPASAAARSA